jgi:hypothetical protein
LIDRHPVRHVSHRSAATRVRPDALGAGNERCRERPGRAWIGLGSNADLSGDSGQWTSGPAGLWGAANVANAAHRFAYRPGRIAS